MQHHNRTNFIKILSYFRSFFRTNVDDLICEISTSCCHIDLTFILYECVHVYRGIEWRTLKVNSLRHWAQSISPATEYCSLVRSYSLHLEDVIWPVKTRLEHSLSECYIFNLFLFLLYPSIFCSLSLNLIPPRYTHTCSHSHTPTHTHALLHTFFHRHSSTEQSARAVGVAELPATHYLLICWHIRPVVQQALRCIQEPA